MGANSGRLAARKSPVSGGHFYQMGQGGERQIKEITKSVELFTEVSNLI